MADILQSATWPGVAGVQSCTYVCSHGVSPGRAVMVTDPQTALPRAFGNLTFSDGVRTVVIPNCKAESVTPQYTSEGQVYTIEILDERWQWGRFGGLNGHYNQTDDHGKLVPWTVKSPRELAAIIMAALGVRRGTIQLPDGLTSAMGKNLERFLKRGENFPQSLTNPETIWNRTPPAEALAQLCDTYGCRPVYQPLSKAVSILLPGRGKTFPVGPVEASGKTIAAPPAPAFVGVFGAPVKIQARFLLEAVGEEWDGSIVPINLLSYAPASAEKKPQISQIRTLATGEEALSAKLVFTDPKTGAEVTKIVSSTADGVDRLAAVRFGMIADPTVAAAFKLTNGPGLVLRFSAPFPFTLSCFNPLGENGFQVDAIQAFVDPATGSWIRSNPPLFPNVQATERLSFLEAQALARKSVFRYYRILNRDPHDFSDFTRPGRVLSLPWWGKIGRRQQILLQDTKVEQVVPQARIPGAINKENAKVVGVGGNVVNGQGVLPDFYNGYSRDRPNTVTGSVYFGIGTVNWLWLLDGNPDGKFNTDPEARVFAEFSTNQKEQMIVFGEPVYKFVSVGAFPETHEPLLTLEAGCFVTHPDTNAVVRWEEVLPIAGGVAPTEWTHREDVQVGVVGKYADYNRSEGFEYSELADARARAGYYLRGQAARHKITGGETRQYIGIVLHEPDGYCQQVTWSVGNGATTILSGNTEHNPAIPTYPTRRRAESLPPDKAAAAANLAERALVPVPKEV